MKKRYWIDHTIRGDFYRIELTKRYSGMPGFAPEYYDNVIGTVTVKFRDEPPYFQTGGDTHIVLAKADVKQILELLKTGYHKADFPPTKPDQEKSIDNEV